MDISSLTSLITAFRAETRQDAITPDTLGQLLQKIVNFLKEAGDTAEQQTKNAKPFYHIECDSQDQRLVVKYPAKLLADGYVPYLLRFSKRSTHYRDINDRETRSRGPMTRGWHLFYGSEKIKVSQVGDVSFGRNVGTEENPMWVYEENIRNLFGDIEPIYKGTPPRRILVGYKVPFGSKRYIVKNNHRFRFGIVFGPKITAKGNRSLNFANCPSNIAEFWVNFHRTTDTNDEEEYYELSYSI